MKVRSLCAGWLLSNTVILFKSNKCGDDGFAEEPAGCLAAYVWRDLRLVAVAVHFAPGPKVSSKLYPKEFWCPLATEDASHLLHNFCFAKSNQI